MITTAQFNDFVKNAMVKWREGYDRADNSITQLYDITDTDFQTSDHSQIDGYGYARRKGEGDQVTKGTLKQGYSVIINQTVIALEDTITWEMRRFDRYREINKLLAGMGEAAAQRYYLDLTHQFTFGNATSYTNMDGETISTAVGDGLALFSAVHTITGSSAVFSNVVSGNPVFSKAGLEAAESLFTQMINMNGVKVIVKPDTIITSDDPATVNAVKEFLQSTGYPDSAENGVNVYKGKYKHIILPLLATDSNGAYNSAKARWWFLAALNHKDAICEVAEQPHLVMPKPFSNLEDEGTRDWTTQTFATYDYAVLDPKWIVASLPS